MFRNVRTSGPSGTCVRRPLESITSPPVRVSPSNGKKFETDTTTRDHVNIITPFICAVRLGRRRPVYDGYLDVYDCDKRLFRFERIHFLPAPTSSCPFQTIPFRPPPSNDLSSDLPAAVVVVPRVLCKCFSSCVDFADVYVVYVITRPVAHLRGGQNGQMPRAP